MREGVKWIMMGGGEVKVATVEVESSVDNMATLPVSRAQQHHQEAEKNNAANKEMELKKVQPKPDKRYPLFGLCDKSSCRGMSLLLGSSAFLDERTKWREVRRSNSVSGTVTPLGVVFWFEPVEDLGMLISSEQGQNL